MGIAAKIKTTFATLVFSTAQTKAGEVDPIKKQYSQPNLPIKNKGFIFLKPAKVINAAKIDNPAAKLRQKAIVNSSDDIRRTNNESGVTNKTPKKVSNIPF